MFKKVFMWLFLGFLVTFISSYLVVDNIDIVAEVLIAWPFLRYAIFFVPIIIAILLSGIIKKIPVILTIILYIIYVIYIIYIFN